MASEVYWKQLCSEIASFFLAKENSFSYFLCHWYFWASRGKVPRSDSVFTYEQLKELCSNQGSEWVGLKIDRLGKTLIKNVQQGTGWP